VPKEINRERSSEHGKKGKSFAEKAPERKGGFEAGKNLHELCERENCVLNK